MSSKLSVTTSTAKLAWLRDPSAPAGQSALGRFQCPCGASVDGVDYASGETYPCPCGRTWDSRGWLVGGAA
jgi:hypothetical protein